MFPERALVNLTMAKTRLFAAIEADSAYRRLYDETVETLTWMYSLSPEHINIAADSSVSKIDVHYLKLKKDSVKIGTILEKIEAKLPKQAKRIYFTEYAGDWKMYVVYRILLPGSQNTKDYLLSKSQKPDEIQFPNAYNLSGLFSEFIKQTVCVTPRQKESMDELVYRDYRVHQLTAETEVLTKKMNAEVQPKQRIEMNIHLQKLEEDISKLKSN